MFPTGGTNLAGTATMQRFNSSGVWQPPFGVTTVYLIAVGGGQGGGGASTPANGSAAHGGGGGGGQVVYGWYNVNGPVTITIGSGGAGATAPVVGASATTNYGTNGGDTILSGGISLTALGGGTGGHGSGTGGGYSSNSGLGGGGGASGEPLYPSVTAYVASGTLLYKLTPGYQATNTTDTLCQGRRGVLGFGGGGYGGFYVTNGWAPVSADGGGAPGRSTGVNAAAGGNATANTGGGGGGASANNTGTGVAGGNGADGTVIIVWWA